MRKDISTNDKDINDLFLKVVDLVTQARERVATAVNIAEVYTKFHIGQYIVEYEQKGETRAEYGKAVLKELSKRLTDRLGDGWSYSTLKNIRQFYIVFSKGLTSGCPKSSQKANQWLADYMVFALTGADLGAKLGGKPVPRNRAVYVSEDSTLSFGFAAEGARGYLTVAGGFDVPVVMDSKSTYLRAKIGGVNGGPLQDGTELSTGELSPEQENLVAALSRQSGKPFASMGWSVPNEDLFSTEPIRVTEGLQTEWFTQDTLHTFFTSPYTITPQSDRMGYRLSGAALPYKDTSLELISEPVSFGSIQVPADGNPIILMADRQTTGGYAKIGQVIQADLPWLAQMKPGGTIYFAPVSLTQAENALAKQEAFLEQVRQMVKR